MTEIPDVGDILITSDALQARVAELGTDISKDYADRDPLVIGVLKGAFMFMADLAKGITIPVEFDFMAVASYGVATKTSGVVRILKDLDADIENRHVLLIEDIIDSGLTVNYLLKNLHSRGPASLKICALLQKQGAQRVELDIAYTGFEIPDTFVVGYGLDVAQRYRNLPYIATLQR